jgi:archaellum biogenesis ATPase FlaH
VLPYLKNEYFIDNTEKLLFDEVHSYITKYNAPPSREALEVSLGSKETLSEDEFKESLELITQLHTVSEPADIIWLETETEKFCQERALHNAIATSIHIMDGTDKVNGKGVIPKILSDALAVSFDPAVGHDYLEDTEERYAFYHHEEEKIPFDLTMLNKITRGGLPKKSLTIYMGGVNCGKTMLMVHHAAACLAQNKNVLYITLEMAEERIAERIDANLMNVDLNTLEELDHETYTRKAERLKDTIKGKLIIKEFPTAGASVTNFKALLNELWLKKHFKPDVIFVDYINIMCSSRVKPGNNVNSYTLIKAIAEELRGLAVEFCVPVISATQLTRVGFTSSDPGLEDTAESFGLPATADLMLVLIRTEELDQLRQVMLKQLKNRFNDVTQDKRFVVGVNFARMRFSDVDDKAQKGISDANPSKDKFQIPGGRKPRQEDLEEVHRSLKSKIGALKV